MASAAASADVLLSVDRRMIPYHFTVDQYHQMIDAGVFVNARCELLEGVVVEKVTHNPPHDVSISLLQRRLLRHLSEEWVLRIQSSVSLADSQPEPDLVVAVGPERRYSRHHPYPADIALVIEVAESSLDQDRVDKKRIYAAARLPVYWIVNLVDRQVEVYSSPRAGRSPTYRQRQDFQPGAAVPLHLAGKEVARLPVRELLP
jgi:Uma2 family endonuclease